MRAVVPQSAARTRRRGKSDLSLPGENSPLVSGTQLTLIQIDNYGPWTVTPSPRRETDLQTMQSRLYADLSQFIGSHDGYVFFTRFDNMVAVTNGMDRAAHKRLQETVRNRYPVSVSLSVAHEAEPAGAIATASRQLQEAGSAQDGDRREILRVDRRGTREDDRVHIAHFDINNVTESYTDELNAFDTFLQVEQGYATLMRYMWESYGGLSFFVGGDNIIAVCPDLEARAYEEIIDHVSEQTDVALKVGVGSDRQAQPAGMAAKHALETCRTRGTRVEIAGVTP